MTKLDFYFDPVCPFCWITSRWLHVVSQHRELDITWRPFSLALKNDVLIPHDSESSHAAASRDSHRVLRVIAAAARHHNADAGELYTTFGMKFHVAGFPYDDTWIRAVLDEHSLPADELLAAADDASYDDFLRGEMQSALDTVGDDAGVPIVVLDLPSGKRQGYFGPVLNDLPDLDECLQIWDGLEKLATVDSFYELKRTRPSGDPNIASTARC